MQSTGNISRSYGSTLSGSIVSDYKNQGVFFGSESHRTCYHESTVSHYDGRDAVGHSDAFQGGRSDSFGLDYPAADQQREGFSIDTSYQVAPYSPIDYRSVIELIMSNYQLIGKIKGEIAAGKDFSNCSIKMGQKKIDRSRSFF